MSGTGSKKGLGDSLLGEGWADFKLNYPATISSNTYMAYS